MTTERVKGITKSTGGLGFDTYGLTDNEDRAVMEAVKKVAGSSLRERPDGGGVYLSFEQRTPAHEETSVRGRLHQAAVCAVRKVRDPSWKSRDEIAQEERSRDDALRERRREISTRICKLDEAGLTALDVFLEGAGV